ncbi:MAG: IS200/IS605 family element transposase accessory protein TnpB, partial [Thaumarchaeota archaeon]
DARIGGKIASKYGRRRRNRINHLLNWTTRQIVEEAYESKETIVLEDIKESAASTRGETARDANSGAG